ncbi:MAG: hypothetical protein Q8K28_02925 [Hoeflea sp.]|uniref:hypothetical protein n=1 Tax=Hoeflea sp. TaxID=1940281 RepID=UPI0027317384|nr:hypothetical protein [Hoeflea sp.]MDP2118835.1 hypothetical protein [Hoeflea sp.]
MLIDKVVDFQVHVQKIMNDHFEVVYDAEYLIGYHVKHSPHYAKYLWTNENPTELTDEQVFLKAMFDLISPVLEADSLYKKISRTQPKPDSWRASERLIRPCGNLAHETYNYTERLKLYLNSAKSLCNGIESTYLLDSIISKRLKTFKTRFKHIMAYRNYLVHAGPKIIDPFSELSYMEIAAITGHSDIWFIFNNSFDEAKHVWRANAKLVRDDMVQTLAEVKSVNEDILRIRGFKFAS